MAKRPVHCPATSSKDRWRLNLDRHPAPVFTREGKGRGPFLRRWRAHEYANDCLTVDWMSESVVDPALRRNDGKRRGILRLSRLGILVRLARILQHHRSPVFADHDAGRVGYSGDDRRHDRGIGDPQAVAAHESDGVDPGGWSTRRIVLLPKGAAAGWPPDRSSSPVGRIES